MKPLTGTTMPKAHEGLQPGIKAQPPALTGTDAAKLKQACTEFESIFISMIMRQMMDSIPKSGASATGSSILSGIADQAVAEHLAKCGGFGLGDSLFRDLSKTLLR